jgi:hypothetical protein
MTFKVIDSRKAFVDEITGLVATIEQAEISLKAQNDEKKDGFHRCWKCGDHMCDVTEPTKLDGQNRYIVGQRYFQCFTKRCKGRKEFMH